MEDSSSPASVFYNEGGGGIRQLEDSSSPASVFYNVGEGGIRQLEDSSSPASVFYNEEKVVLGSWKTVQVLQAYFTM